ncbi:unnamed protein product, partial [Rotaria magnacalcarata]
MRTLKMPIVFLSLSTTIAAITATTTFSTTTSTKSTTPKATITTTTTTTTATTVTTVKVTTTRTTTGTIINATAAAGATTTVEKATQVSTTTEVASTTRTTTTRTTGKTVAPTVTATIGASGTKTTAITNATISGATTTTTLTRRRLTSEDTVDENDPFVEIRLPNSRQQSSTNVVQDNRTPTWNQSFTFDVHPQDDLIVFDVKDKDLSNHDMIGSGAMKLKNVFDNGKFDEWITIHVSDGSLTTGEIHVIMNIE